MATECLRCYGEIIRLRIKIDIAAALVPGARREQSQVSAARDQLPFALAPG
jgi:hypothetical protein